MTGSKLSRILIPVLIIVSLSASVYFFTRGTGERIAAKSSIPEKRVVYKNKQFLHKKVGETGFYEKTNTTSLEIVVSDKVQDRAVAVRANASGEPETSLAYSITRTGEHALLTLYVNPSMYPSNDPDELNRQYTQLLLIALYEITPGNDPDDPAELMKFLADYRADINANAIFEIN